MHGLVRRTVPHPRAAGSSASWEAASRQRPRHMAAVPPLPEGWEERRDQQVSPPGPLRIRYCSVSVLFSDGDMCFDLNREQQAGHDSNFPEVGVCACTTRLPPSPLPASSPAIQHLLDKPLPSPFRARETRTTLTTSRGRHHGATPSFKASPQQQHRPPAPASPPPCSNKRPPQRTVIAPRRASSTALPTARYAIDLPFSAS